MNRLLLVLTALFALNALLLLFVTFRLCESRVEAAGKEERPAGAWTTADLRVVQAAPERDDKRVHHVTLDLGAELVQTPAGDEDGIDAAALGLRLEPDVEAVACVRPGGRQIDLAFRNGLQPGRRHHLHLGKALRDRHGRELAAGAVLAFATPTIELGRVVLEESETPDVPPALLASFDLPVELAAVREHVRVVRVDTGASVTVKVEAVAHPDEYLFRVVPELPAVVQRIALVVAPGLRPRGGDVGIEHEQVRTFALREPLRLVSAQASEGAIELHFNRTVTVPRAGLIALEPAVPFQVFRRGTGLRLVGAFAAGSTVAVQIAAGFPGTGRGLDEPLRWSVLFPELHPHVDFARKGNVLSARAEPMLEVSCVNVEQFRLRARRVYPNNVVRMVQRADNEAMAPAPVRTFAVKGPRNQPVVHRVDLREVLGPDARGFHLLELWKEGQSWPVSRLVQVTDLGVTVRAAGNTVAVQVVSIANGGAVAEADVQVLSLTNQLLAEGRTDERGALLLQWNGTGGDRIPFLVRAKSSGDEACVDFRNHGVELADPGLGGRPHAQGAEAYVWPVRGIVRPGERIEAGVLVRDAACATVAGRALTVAFVAPNGRTFRRERVTTGGSGLVTVAMETSTDVPAGSWQINVLDGDEGAELGSAVVQVEAFVPYRLEADVAAKAQLYLGGACTARISGRWLDGTPAAGRPVTLRVRLQPGEFKAKGVEGFTFARGAGEPPPGELPAVEGVLDGEGRAELTVALPADAAQQTLTAVLMAEVLDPSGRPVRAASEAPVLRKELHLGVRASRTGVDLCAVSAQGALLGGEIPATVRLERRSWHSQYEAVGDSRWRWRTSVQGSVIGEWPAMLREGKASVALDCPRGQGWLAVVATAGGVSVEQDIGEVPLRPDRLRVEGPAASVLPGTTARITVDAPCTGRAFVTLEGTSVLSANVVDLMRGRNEVFVAIPEGTAVPNLHAVVTLTRALREAGPASGPSWLVGGTAIVLQRDEVRGEVTLKTPAQVLPGSTVQCEVLAPGATSALVALVDEGVLAVTGHRAPEPAAFFLGKRRLGTAGADGSSALMEGAVFVAGTRTGGDGDGADPMSIDSVSPRIRALSMSSEVRLDAAGRGVATFTLPEYEGRVRVMVLAAGPRSFGAVAAATVVQAPCGLQVAMPRMVAPGDRFAAVVSLRNATGSAGEVELRCTAEGLQLDEGGTAAIPLQAGGTSHHLVWLRALEPVAGKPATLHASARIGTERRQVSSLVHVRELRLPAAEHVGLRLGPAQELRIGEGFHAEGLRAVIDLDGGPDRQLRPGLEAMLQYAYGCVEQTTSRGFAVLACQALLDRIYGPEQAPPQAAHLVQAAVDRLAGMQNWRGGFGWWPGEHEEFPFNTVYAVDFLWSAREAGCRVADATLQAGLQRVQQIAASDIGMSLRCHACEVLSRSGNAVKSRVVWLASLVREPEDRALLALALCRFGEKERAREVLQGKGEEVTEAAWTRADTTFLGSPLRTRSLRLRALLALDPADARLPELAFAMQREVLQPERLQTQELGQALRALAAWCSTMGARGRSEVAGTIDGVPLPKAVGGRIEFAVRPGSVLSLAAGGSGLALLSVHGMRVPVATAGDVLQVTRTVIDPGSGKVAKELRSGHVYQVRLEGRAKRALEQVVLVDLLPGGLEPEAAPPGAAPTWSRTAERGAEVRIEARDDRVLLFPKGRFTGEFKITYLVRAALPGTYGSQPLVAQAMYDPEAKFTSAVPAEVVVLP